MVVRSVVAAMLLVAGLSPAAARTPAEACEVAILHYDFREIEFRADQSALRSQVRSDILSHGTVNQQRYREAAEINARAERDLAQLRQAVRRSCAPGMTMQFHPDSSLIPELCDLGKTFARPRSATVCVLRAR